MGCGRMSGIKRVDVNVKNSELQNQNVMIGVRKEEVKSSTSRFHYNWCMYVLHDQTLYDAFLFGSIQMKSRKWLIMVYNQSEKKRETEGEIEGEKRGIE